MNTPHSQESLKHTMDILRAAMPHLNNSTKKPIELAVQASELLENFSSLQHTDELSACGLQDEPVDIEALLTTIQDVCNDSEKEVIHMMLNFLNTKKIYQAYDAFRSVGQSGTKDSNSFAGSPNIMDFLLSQMPPEQKSNFDNLNMLMSAMNL